MQRGVQEDQEGGETTHQGGNETWSRGCGERKCTDEGNERGDNQAGRQEGGSHQRLREMRKREGDSLAGGLTG